MTTATTSALVNLQRPVSVKFPVCVRLMPEFALMRVLLRSAIHLYFIADHRELKKIVCSVT